MERNAYGFPVVARLGRTGPRLEGRRATGFRTAHMILLALLLALFAWLVYPDTLAILIGWAVGGWALWKAERRGWR